MITFIKRIVAGQKKLYATLGIVLSLLSGFEFVLLSMYTSANINDTTSLLIARLVPSMAIFLSFFLTLYMNHFFVDSKIEEFSVILLSGRNLRQISKYIVIQFGTLFVVTAIIGTILGNGLLWGINQILYLSQQEVIFRFQFLETMYVFVSFVIVKIIYIFILNLGKFYRIKEDLIEYINKASIKKSVPGFFSQFTIGDEKRKLPIGKLLSCAFSFFMAYICIAFIIKNMGDIEGIMIRFVILLICEISIIDTTIPLLFDLLHDRFLLRHPVLLMACSQLMDFSTAMRNIVDINACLIPLLCSFLLIPMIHVEAQTIIMVCFFIIMCMIALIFMIRFAIYLPTKTSDIATLQAIGYDKQKMYRIQTIEMVIFLLFFVGIPVIVYGIILYQCYLMQFISLATVWLLSGSYVVLYSLLCGYMIISYRKLTKEVLSDVKYLNRSE